jgi:hypothetical protein
MINCKSRSCYTKIWHIAAYRLLDREPVDSWRGQSACGRPTGQSAFGAPTEKSAAHAGTHCQAPRDRQLYFVLYSFFSRHNHHPMWYFFDEHNHLQLKYTMHNILLRFNCPLPRCKRGTVLERCLHCKSAHISSLVRITNPRVH